MGVMNIVGVWMDGPSCANDDDGPSCANDDEDGQLWSDEDSPMER